MSDELKRLHERVDALHRRLAGAESLSPELSDELNEVLSELEQHLAAERLATESRSMAPLADRLVEAGRYFESAHPVLGRTIGNLADALSRMGI